MNLDALMVCLSILAAFVGGISGYALGLLDAPTGKPEGKETILTARKKLPTKQKA